ncbi:ATP-binding protein [Nonomuraea purpurea]|uniref:ATP-binding protein n=1 Tax=Nonomuraea purpurea TaxID=1849276 RepID=A0ABV8G578_9ACTN
MSRPQLLAELLVPGVGASVSLLRLCVGRILTAAGHRDVDDVRLVVSELATNAVSHSRSGRPGGFVILEVSAIGDALARVEVIDEGGITIPRPRQAGEGEGNGRGLHLVDELSVRWGVDPGPLGGCVVWAEVLTAEDTPAAAADVVLVPGAGAKGETSV